MSNRHKGQLPLFGNQDASSAKEVVAENSEQSAVVLLFPQRVRASDPSDDKQLVKRVLAKVKFF